MAMKVKVEITETLQRIVEFEAESIEDAERQAWDSYRNADIILGPDDFVSSDVNVV